jgi:putative Holliday junction resolvase
LTVRPLEPIQRRNWKDLLYRIQVHIRGLDVRAIVVGLPLNLDGSEGAAATNARDVAENLRKSTGIEVYLQDERLTTEEARARLKSIRDAGEIERRVDSEAAAIILQDFLSQEQR